MTDRDNTFSILDKDETCLSNGDFLFGLFFLLSSKWETESSSKTITRILLTGFFFFFENPSPFCSCEIFYSWKNLLILDLFNNRVNESTHNFLTGFKESKICFGSS